ncbi:MAG: hypothetical protein GXO23_07835 [Crenarchaeota archaeon]|nr:hypothetical protein [Thermoproteota archaeon]
MCRPLRRRDESLGTDRELKYLERLLNMLEDPYSEYWSRGVLNSEGMTILMNIIRILAKKDINLMRLMRTCLRDRTYDHVHSRIIRVKEKLGLDVACRESLTDFENLLRIYGSPSWNAERERAHREDTSGDR